MEKIGIKKDELGKINEQSFFMKKGDFEFKFDFAMYTQHRWILKSIIIERKATFQRFNAVLKYKYGQLCGLFLGEDNYGFMRQTGFMKGINPDLSNKDKDKYPQILDIRSQYNHQISDDLYADDRLSGYVLGSYNYKPETDSFFEKKSYSEWNNKHDSLLAIISQPKLVKVLLDIIHYVTKLFEEEKQNHSIEEIELRDIDDVDFSELFSWFEIEKNSFEKFGYNMERNATITVTDIAREDMKRRTSQSTNEEIKEEFKKSRTRKRKGKNLIEGADRDD